MFAFPSKFHFLILGIILNVVSAGIGLASSESYELSRQGVESLKERKLESALKKFKSAEKTDPSDADAVFFQGATLNRLGRYRAALEKLENAEAMGSQHPDLKFEMGWSFLREGSIEKAITALEAYEKSSPGRAQTSEFLGRAYILSEQDAKGEAKLKEALSRDPKLKPTVSIYLAILEDKRNNSELYSEHLKTILRESPDSPLARALLEQVAWVIAKGQKPWNIAFSLNGGYNSNVLALGESVALPIDLSSKDAAFFRFTLGGSYGWYLSPKDSLSAGYSLLADFYNDVSSNDTLNHYFYGQYGHAFNARQLATFRLSDEFTMLDSNKFRNRISLRPAFSYGFKDWLVGEIYYGLAFSDYYFSTPEVQNRDGTGHTLGLNGYLKIPNTRFLIRAGYYHLWNLADGSDFDFDSNAISLGLSHPLFWEIMGEVFYTHLFDSYDNNNSLAGGGFDFPRDDDIDIFTVQVNRSIRDWLRAYVRYDYTRDDSNIPFYKFDQDVVFGGLIISF
jgi:tetratricopeptide (TPR) repeat protein